MVNTVSYTNIFGEEVSTATILSDMIANLQSKVQKGESSLTDVNIGSELRNLFEANSEGIFRLLRENDAIGRMQSVRLATGGYLDDKGYEVGLTRKGGNYANGSVIFSISTPLQIDYTIYAGTGILNSKTGLRYVLNDDVTIRAGSTWNSGIVYAEGTGAEYNCPAHTLTAFDTGQYLRGDLTVDNDYAFENGDGTESDDDFRKRILNAMRGGSFGSWAYYQRICEQIDGVHDVNFVKPETLNKDKPRHFIVNSDDEVVVCNDCTAVCILNEEEDIDDDADVLRELTELLTNQYNLVLGHEFHVQTSVKEKYYFSINYYADENNIVTESEVVDCLETLIHGGVYEGKQSIVYDGFYVGDTISKEVIIDALENMDGIHHVESLKIMKWHEDMTQIISDLTNWIQKNNLYGSTVSNPFKYSDILDFPDDDDPEYKAYNGTTTVPAWKHIGTNELEQEVYLLVVEGYYFYKIKDNTIDHDDNEGEYSLVGEEDYWGWGELIFDDIELKPDSAFRLGSLSDKQPNSTHSIRLHQLG